jgi:galactosamine-6-phosphate isomerase
MNGMVADMGKKPSFGLTMGVKDILSAKHIIMLVAGKGKEEATKNLVSGDISNKWPATHLWSHANVDCLIVG